MGSSCLLRNVWEALENIPAQCRGSCSVSRIPECILPILPRRFPALSQAVCSGAADIVGEGSISHCTLSPVWSHPHAEQLFLLLSAQGRRQQRKNGSAEETICSANTFWVIKLELFTADFILRENTDETNVRWSQLLNSNLVLWYCLIPDKKLCMITEGNCNFGLNMPRGKKKKKKGNIQLKVAKAYI